LSGSQDTPPDHAVVPPTVSAFSNSPTEAPSAAARSAAVSPVARAEDDDVVLLDGGHRAR